jgi:hypothetical protein
MFLFFTWIEIGVWRDYFHELGAHFELSLDAFMRIGNVDVIFWMERMIRIGGSSDRPISVLCFVFR